ncbi:hypothetical protein ACFLSJ_04625 [Verrucomicrobiota bacterium]
MNNGRPAPWMRNGLTVGVFAVLALVFTGPVFRDLGNWGIQDWDVHLFLNAAARVGMLQHGQFPLWNPWWCGGMPLLARPESAFLCPSCMLILPLGDLLGMKVQIWLHLVIGLTGTFALARHYGLRHAAAGLSALVYMMSSMYASILTAGMVWGFMIAYIPWTFLFYLKSFDDFRCAFASSVFLALMWLGGGVYPFCITGLFLGVHGLFSVVTRKTAWGATALRLAAVYAVAFGLGAVKFLPAIEFTMQYPRHHDLYCGFSLHSLFYSLFGRDQTVGKIHDLPKAYGFIKGYSHAMNETGMYIGVLPFVLFLAGLAARWRKRLPLLLCFVLFLWLGFGMRVPLSPWSILHRLPVFNIMRVAERFRFVFMLCLAIFAGLGLQALADALRNGRVPEGLRRRAGPALWAVLCFVLVDLMVVSVPVWKDAFTIRPLPSVVQGLNPTHVARSLSSPFIQTWTHVAIASNGFATADSDTMYCAYSSHYPSLLSNLGVIYGYEEVPVPKKAVPFTSPEYRGEAFIHGTDGDAYFSEWSPNSMAARVHAAGEGLLVINQNYYSGWRVKEPKGRVTESFGGLMAVRVTPGDREVVLVYSPASFKAGLGLSLATLALVCAGLWWDRRRRRQTA